MNFCDFFELIIELLRQYVGDNDIIELYLWFFWILEIIFILIMEVVI